jgi:GNAT superfamily N-acetyltransferase
MNIRRLEQQDKKELTKLLKEFYDFTLASINNDLQPFLQAKNEQKTIEEWAKENFSKSKIVFVAEEENKLSGFICATIIPKKGVILSKEGFIENLFVTKNQRRKGIGKLLFNKTVSECKNKKCTHIGLSTFFTYKDAIKFYEDLGFTPFDMQLKKKI